MSHGVQLSGNEMLNRKVLSLFLSFGCSPDSINLWNFLSEASHCWP